MKNDSPELLEASLQQHVELLRCHYNLVRRHRGLKFGSSGRTPAMQARLVRKRVSFRLIFPVPHADRRRVAAAFRLYPCAAQQMSRQVLALTA